MTKLVASIPVDDLRAAWRSAHAARRAGADAVELRLDSFDGDPAEVRAYLQSHRDLCWIVTCRSADEGGSYRGDTRERVSALIGAARDSGAYVDFEWADWQRSDNIRQKVRLSAGEHRLILSLHDFAGVPQGLAATVAGVLAVPGVCAAKVAYRCERVDDSFHALDLMHEHQDRVVAIGMGDAGAWTRVLAKKLGSWATYARLSDLPATAPGQLAVDELVSGFHWPRIGPNTKVFGVLGDPVGHSMSPLVFNRWMAAAGIDAVYLPIRMPGGPEVLSAFLDGCRARPWLDVGGFSVTLPHKAAAASWCGEDADWMVRGIGATNTLVFDRDRVRAHNTDSFAAVSAVVEGLGCRHTDLLGMRVDLLGAGGAARAVLYGLDFLGCRHTLYVREPEKVAALAARYRCEVRPWPQRDRRSGDVVINCTSIGMMPHVDESPLGSTSFDGCRLVFDMVYHPIETRLLRDARRAGVRTVSGLEMFIRQAAMQFSLWFRKPADGDAARRWVVAALSASSESEASS